MKKIFIIWLMIFTLSSANEISYLDENKMDYSNIRTFVGVDIGYSYLLKREANMDDTVYPYSLYVGIPVMDYEAIFKYKISTKDDFEFITNNLILNIPIDGSGANMTYFGIVAGYGQLTWKDDMCRTLQLTKRTINKSFYGVHIGQRYKYSRNFYVKIEMEYVEYNLPFENSLEFIYGVEYRF
jgi:hypothetical protein